MVLPSLIFFLKQSPVLSRFDLSLERILEDAEVDHESLVDTLEVGFRNNQQLNELNLVGVHWPSQSDLLGTLVSNCQQLESLALTDGCPSTTGMLSLAKAIKRCPRITNLRVLPSNFNPVEGGLQTDGVGELVNAVVAEHPQIFETFLYIFAMKTPVSQLTRSWQTWNISKSKPTTLFHVLNRLWSFFAHRRSCHDWKQRG
jgi:hypothetical protein